MQELVKREIGVYSSRVERYPRDTRIKYELAQRYMRVQSVAKAIPLLQQASVDTRFEASALLDLAKCFISEKKGPLARRQLKRLLEKIDSHDNKDQFLAGQYWSGRLAEEAGENTTAVDHYTEVIALDYGYKDACDRLEKLESE